MLIASIIAVSNAIASGILFRGCSTSVSSAAEHRSVAISPGRDAGWTIQRNKLPHPPASRRSARRQTRIAARRRQRVLHLRHADHRQLLLEVLALAFWTFGLLAAIDEGLEVVVAILTDVTIQRHVEFNPSYVLRFLYISAAWRKTSCSCSVRLSLPFTLIFSSTASSFASRCSSTELGA